MKNDLIKKSIVLGILVLVVASDIATGFPGSSGKLKKPLPMSLENAGLINGTNAQRVHNIQELLSYHQQIIAEDERYKQVMEEEYLPQRYHHKISPEKFFDTPPEDISNPRFSLGVILSLLNPNINSNNIKEKRIPKPRPIPTRVTLYVGGSGPNNYTKIQDAIDHAIDGDRVFVYDDSSPYFEHLNVNKSIYLIGEDRNSTVIDGQWKEDVVTITSDYVNVRGFTIQNGTVGILLESSSNNTIFENTIANNSLYGIGLYSSSSNNTLSNNTITNNSQVGIYMLYSSGTIIAGNTFEANGIVIGGDKLTHYNSHTIENNMLNGRPIRYYKNCNNIIVPEDAVQVIIVNCNGFTIQNTNLSGGSIGIELAFSKNSLLIGNIIENNSWAGIALYSSSNNIISNNTIANNSWIGIDFLFSSNNIISDKNTITNNGNGIYIDSCSNNTITKNIITNHSGDGIGIDSYDSSSSNNTITKNIITNNDDTGIVILSSNSSTISSYNTISGNTIANNSLFGIDLFVSSNDIISANVITNNVVGIGVYGLLGFLGDKNTIVGNAIANNSWIGIDVSGSSINTISGNTIENNSGSGIMLGSSYFNKISDNYCCSNQIDGIGLYELCSANTIENNTCLNNMKGIAIRDSGLNHLRNNYCAGNMQGILLNNAYLTKITDNQCSYNSIAIYLYKSRLNCIKNNDCNHSDFDGIVLEDSGLNILSNNVAGPYNWIGIVIQTSTFNWLLHNNVFNNIGYGVALLKTFGNHLNLNNIHDNAQKDLIGLFCFDNARWNYWGNKLLPNKLVLGWVRILPWLRNPVELSDNFDDIAIGDLMALQEYKSLSSSLLIKERSYLANGRIN